MGANNKAYAKELKRLREIYGITNAYNNFEEQVCNYLVKSKNEFDRECLYKFINEYIKDKIPYNRIMLFKIYTFISSLDDSDNNVLLENLESLLSFANDNIEKKNSETNKVIKKLYDYIYLANLQDEKVRKIFDNNIEKAKNDIDAKVHKEIEYIESKVAEGEKKIERSEKNYITILGIFASLVVTFVSGLLFSSEVLSNISSVSVYRLIVVILLLGFVLITICFSLYWFITKIINNDNDKELTNIYLTTIKVIVMLLLICGLLWGFGIVEGRNKSITPDNNLIRFIISKIEEYNGISTISEIK